MISKLNEIVYKNPNEMSLKNLPNLFAKNARNVLPANNTAFSHSCVHCSTIVLASKSFISTNSNMQMSIIKMIISSSD